MDKDYLVLKRASTSRSSGEWNDDDYDVLAEGAVDGRMLKVQAAPVGSPWIWTLAFGQQAQWATPARRADEGRDCGAAEIQRTAQNAPRWPDVNTRFVRPSSSWPPSRSPCAILV